MLIRQRQTTKQSLDRYREKPWRCSDFHLLVNRFRVRLIIVNLRMNRCQ